MEQVVFDERIAAGYDASSPHMYAPEVLGPTVDLLAELAGDGRALELAVGTGRVALPLSERGVPVSGIDVSAAMVERLRAKPGADGVDAVVGDMTTTTVPGPFRLVYLVYNTLGNLDDQGAQVRCFRNAADHLEPGGCFVVEIGVPDLRRLPPGERTRGFTLEPHHVGFDEYVDLVAQRARSHHWWAVGDRVERFVCPFRYVWPAELDLMAQLAGLELRDRWSGWGREPFDGDSPSHISVWEKPL